MRVSKTDVEPQIAIPGATLRQKLDFGDATGLGAISCEYFSLDAGVDTAPLFVGLEGDLCQCPHWGFVLQGALAVTYASGRQETVRKHDLFYWPKGHNVKVLEAAELIMFSPQAAHSHVLDHMREKLEGAAAAG
ncbi:MAG: hypothetical protein KC543_02630 [Myxococcales bacterium]|nr:hypothetical protein [Myxococcales bacterium]